MFAKNEIKNKLDNCSKNFDVQKIVKLPEDMVNTIFDFLPPMALVFTNTKNYQENHYVIKESLDIYKYDVYVKYMIRSDNYMAFNEILNENYDKWLNIKNFIYKNKTYDDYTCFIKDYCIINDSQKCYDILCMYKENRKTIELKST